MLSDRRKRQVVLGLLGTVLLVTVLGANGVVGAERTVLDADYVTDGLEDEGLYDSLADDMAANFQPEAAPIAVSADGSGPPLEDMTESVVTPAYVQGEVDRNVASLFGYLHGDRDELTLAFDLTPVKRGFGEEFEAWVLEADAATFDPRMGDLLESEAAFEDTRASFKETQLDRIQSRTEEDLSRPALETLYDENRDRIRRELVSRLEEDVAESGGPDGFQAALVDYGSVGIDALVADGADYEQFREAEAAAREDLAAAAGEAVQQALDAEVPDTMDFTADMDEAAVQRFETARTAVTTLDLLALALPVAALLVAGLIGYVSGRRSNALWRVGGVLAVVGLLSAAGATLLSSVIPGMLGGESGQTPPQAEAALGLVTDALGTVALQSALLLVLGLVLVGAGVAIRRDLLPLADEPIRPEADEASDEAA